MDKFNLPIPKPGLCRCGCGRKTTIAKLTINKRGIKKGRYYKYAKGHNRNNIIANNIKFTVDMKTGCWNWDGCINDKGYGIICINRIRYRAHSYIYSIYKKRIRDNEELDHICNNPKCVNPNHLRSVTHKFNVRRCKRVKLNIYKVNEIRELYRSGYKMRELSKKHKTCISNISNIINNKIWT